MGRWPSHRRVALEVLVEQQMNSYRIRRARLEEAGRLREIDGLRPGEWTPGMRAIREQEAQHGLRVEARVFMPRGL